MDDFVDARPVADRDRADAPARDAPPRRRAVRHRRVLRGDARRRAAADPPPAGLVRPRRRRSRSRSCSSTRRRSATCSSARATGSGPSSAGSPTACSGSRVAVGFATLPLPPDPLPRRVVVPGRAAQRDRHGVHRRGRVPRRAARPAAHRPASTRRWRTSTQAVIYALATRLGAPGRDRYMLVLTLGIGLVGGWLTVATGGIAAAFLGHAITRVRGLPVHRPRRPDQAARPRGRGDREAPPAARGLAGHRLAGVGRRGTGDRWRRRRRRRSRSTSTSRSASRSARTATSSSSPGAAARGPRSGSTAFVEALAVELDLRADALDAAFGRGRGRRSRRVYLGGGTPSLLPGRRRSRGCSTLVRDAVRPRRRRRGHARGEPRARRARRRRRRCARAGVTRLSIGAQSMPTRELRRLGPPAPGRRRGATPSPRRARRASARSASTSCTTSRTRRWPTGSSTLDAALALEPDHLSLYALTLDDPDAEGLTGAERRPPADDRGRAPLARRRARPAQDEDRAAAEYHHAVDRLAEAGWRGYEISNWARPGHESRHNLAYWQRRPYEAVGPGRARLRRRDPALERRPARRLPRRAHAGRRAPRRALPPGGAETIDAGDRGGRGGDPRPAHGRAACRSRRPTSRRSADALRLGARRRAPRRHGRRPRRPDDARPAALERAVQPARLSGAGGAGPR